MAGVQFNKKGLTQKDVMWLLVCSEGVEYLRTRKTGDQLYSEPSHNHNQRFLACL